LGRGEEEIEAEERQRKRAEARQVFAKSAFEGYLNAGHV